MTALSTPHLVRPARGRDHGQANGEEHAPVVRVKFADCIRFPKEEIFEACGALALCESLLITQGFVAEAAQVAEIFDRVEARLVGP